jgi:hypothetical protein
MKNFVLSCLALTLIASSALANSEETAVPFQPTAVISPFTYWPTSPRSGRFYRPTGIQVGNTFYMYVQGGAFTGSGSGPGSETCATVGEKALAFTTPWTAQGLRSPFAYAGVVSPCKTDVPMVHYQTGSVFRSSADGQIKLLIDQTENGSDPRSGNFKQVLLGSSTDGLHFNWSTFLKQSQINGVTYSIDEVVLVQATGNSNWWGMYNFASCTLCNGTDGTGFWTAGRIKVVMDSTNVRGFVVYLLASDGVTWSRVNDDGSFNFVPGTMWNYPSHSIVFNNNSWEAWGNGYTGTPPTAGCDDNDMSSYSTFGYQIVTQSGPSGALQTVTSLARPMPTINGYGRISPFRMQDMNGVRLLYSASTDRLCATGDHEGFRGSEIIASEINN